jgi:hypothetical protein
MRRWLLNGCSSCLALALFAAAAPACLNDSEVNKAEREFKSQYQYKTRYQERTVPVSPSPETRPIGPIAATGIGTVLLCGAAVLCFRKAI